MEDRLRNRPPPYTPDQDKPPSYEDSFQDPIGLHPSPTAVSIGPSHKRTNDVDNFIGHRDVHSLRGSFEEICKG